MFTSFGSSALVQTLTRSSEFTMSISFQNPILPTFLKTRRYFHLKRRCFTFAMETASMLVLKTHQAINWAFNVRQCLGAERMFQITADPSHFGPVNEPKCFNERGINCPFYLPHRTRGTDWNIRMISVLSWVFTFKVHLTNQFNKNMTVRPADMGSYECTVQKMGLLALFSIC